MDRFLLLLKLTSARKKATIYQTCMKIIWISWSITSNGIRIEAKTLFLVVHAHNRYVLIFRAKRKQLQLLSSIPQDTRPKAKFERQFEISETTVSNDETLLHNIYSTSYKFWSKISQKRRIAKWDSIVTYYNFNHEGIQYFHYFNNAIFNEVRISMAKDLIDEIEITAKQDNDCKTWKCLWAC